METAEENDSSTFSFNGGWFLDERDGPCSAGRRQEFEAGSREDPELRAYAELLFVL